MSRNAEALSALERFKQQLQKKDKVEELHEVNKILLQERDANLSKLNLIVDLDKEYKPVKITENKKSQSEATAVLVASDWHFEETVDPESVNNLNQYNIKIAEKRAINFFASGMRMIEIFSKDIDINNLVLALLGDFMSGYIHEELMESNSLSPNETVLKLNNVICSGIDYILEAFKGDIIVPCSVGNHGRTTVKSRISTSQKNSFEYLLYKMIAKRYEGNERITFVIDKSYHTYINIYGRDLRFHHGDWVKYMGGIGGLTIPFNKAIAQWNKQRTAYLDVFGHYHQRMLDTGASSFVSNGSLIGYNAYALSIKASYEEPSQSFFLIDKQRGKTVSTPIFVK